jgi:hypothetical protein
LNGFWSAEGRGPVERRFGLRLTISHEGTRFFRRLGDAIGIGASRDQNLDDQIVGKTIGGA